MTSQEQLNRLLNRYEELLEQGHEVSAEEMCRETPHLLDEFQTIVAELRRVDLFMADESPTSGPEELMAAGRYCPLYLHAHGGLGEVFVAEDSELRRKVALKRIRVKGDREAGHRFRFEAEITGRLDHPGVVPVYGLGYDSDGRLYYAMRFIGGESLQQAIKEFHHGNPSHTAEGTASSGFNSLIRRFVVVCQTIAYAHSQGIVHRDLKPANIMLGSYGETVVIDWGLAKKIANEIAPDADTIDFVRGPATGVSKATRLGEIKGSPAYMSPEQAAGQTGKVGNHSDIYSLGATLYTLLTGQMPFEDEDIKKLIDRVRQGHFIHPRQVRADVPRVLEAICLKAMAREPGDRYASALALAADLELWLDGNPVAACREPWLDRARRWMRKHRTFTSTLAASILVALLGISAVAAQQRQSNWLLEKKNDSLKQANQQLAEEKAKATAAQLEAERNLERCAAQLIGMQRALFEDPSVNVYLGHTVHTAIVDKLFHQIDRLADASPRDELGDSIRLWRESSRLSWILSRPALSSDSWESLTKTRSVLETALEQHPDLDQIAIDLAMCRGMEAKCLFESGDTSSTLAAVDKGLTFCEKHSRPGTRFGQHIAYEAACSVAVLAVPNSKETLADLEQTLEFADRALLLIKSNETPTPNDSPSEATRSATDAETKNEKTMNSFRDCFGPAMLLAIKANYLLLLNRDDEALAACKMSLADSGRCPNELLDNHGIVLVKTQAQLMAGVVALAKQNFSDAWNYLLPAWEHAKQLQTVPGHSDQDRGPLSLVQIRLARAAIGCLRSSATGTTFSPAAIRTIRDNAIQAIDDYLAAPESERDKQETNEMQTLKEALQSFSAEPNNR